MSWRDVSIVRKLGAVLVLNTLLAVLLIAGVFTVGTAISRYQDSQSQLLALAQVVGENSRAALAFRDPDGARQVLQALHMQDDVEQVRLYAADGSLFTEIRFKGQANGLFTGDLTQSVLPTYLIANHEIVDEGRVLGRIEVKVRLEHIWAALVRSQALMVLIGGALAALAGLYGMRMRRMVSDPILALKTVTHQVSSSQDYSIRASKSSNDEIGDLVDDFNQMLAEIQTRDAALQSERRSLEQRTMDMKAARDEAERANRVKSEFLSTVSHELRTPLTSIAGSIGLLTGGVMGELKPEVLGLLQVAQTNSQRLSFLINDLLDMEKLMAGKLHFDMQIQEIMPLVEQSLQGNQAYAQALGVNFVLGSRVDAALVQVDGQRFQQVLANLLSNAAKFSEAHSEVNVNVELGGERVRVLVKDQGVGIAPGFHDRIFQKFSQADASDTRKKGGTGLGLAITRELVERMGGAIGFESQPGQGACFHVDLPVAHTSASSPLPPLRVLVVEVDTDVSRLLAIMLSHAGYAVDCATHGVQALALCERNAYAAVTLDLRLPDMAGFDVIRALRARTATTHVPIVVVAAQMQEERLAFEGDTAGIEWLAKPIDQVRLLGSLERLIQRVLHKPTRVLHVEDDLTIHEVVRGMAGARFNFEHATTLREARARVSLERFDVVLLDLTLPNESGWDLLPEIRRQQPEARVVILSEGELNASEASHVDVVLRKTQVSPRELMDAIDGISRTTKPLEGLP